MEIIIDGYNLIGSDRGLRGELEHQRNWLVQRLSLYQDVKGHAATLVFDGWKLGSLDEVSEIKHGVRIVFSRQGEKADSVIVRLARQKGSGCVVVTSDREVRRAVERFVQRQFMPGSSARFYGILSYRQRPMASKTSADQVRKGTQTGSEKRSASV
jgi:predicted RNA-binding protein with PIN domain